MKINIITMHRIINYGSFLQAYGLKKELESLGGGGNNVVFIDYFPQKNAFLHCAIQLIRPTVLRLKHFIVSKDVKKAYLSLRNYRFITEYPNYLGFTNIPNYNYRADLTVIGSDEVFNVCQNSLWKGSMFYFGSEAKYGNICTYAASFGSTTYPLLVRDNLCNSIAVCLNKMERISVRDNNSKEIAETLVAGCNVERHLDPVLIYPYHKEIMEPAQRNYIVVYGYDDRMCERELVEKAKEFAQKTGKKLIAIGGYQQWCDSNIVPTPFEVLGYFKCADYVITDTFHGTVMSIKYQRQFATIIRDQNREKLYDLLSVFGLTDRLVNQEFDLESVLTKGYDADGVRKRIALEQQRSREYFDEITSPSVKK